MEYRTMQAQGGEEIYYTLAANDPTSPWTEPYQAMSMFSDRTHNAACQSQSQRNSENSFAADDALSTIYARRAQ